MNAIKVSLAHVAINSLPGVTKIRYVAAALLDTDPYPTDAANNPESVGENGDAQLTFADTIDGNSIPDRAQLKSAENADPDQLETYAELGELSSRQYTDCGLHFTPLSGEYLRILVAIEAMYCIDEQGAP
jgi:hypothetical protein